MACEHSIPPAPNELEEAVRVLDAREFLGDKRMARLVLDGEVYTLRLTKNDRLILTK